MSQKAVEFIVEFHPEYSTACIEDIQCARCDKRNWNSDCAPFVVENLANASMVKLIMTTVIEGNILDDFLSGNLLQGGYRVAPCHKIRLSMPARKGIQTSRWFLHCLHHIGVQLGYNLDLGPRY